MTEALYAADQAARRLSRDLCVVAVKCRENAADGMMARDGSVALKILAEASRNVATIAGEVCHASPSGAGNLAALISILDDLGADLAGHYREPAQTAVDLRNVRLDARSKAMREDAV